LWWWGWRRNDSCVSGKKFEFFDFVNKVEEKNEKCCSQTHSSAEKKDEVAQGAKR
jgi:hypothetical protein